MDQTPEQQTLETAQEADRKKTRSRPNARRGAGIGLSTIASLFFAATVFTFLFLQLSGRAVTVPDALRTKIEAAINDQLGSQQVRLPHMAISIGRDGAPRVSLSNMAVGTPVNGAGAVLNSLMIRLAPGKLLRGEVAASRLVLDGAQITLRRTIDGAFAFEPDQGSEAEIKRSVPDLLDILDKSLAIPALSSLRDIEAQGIVISLEDARSGRIWQATNANLIVRRAEKSTSLTLVSDVFNGTDNVAELQLSLARSQASSGVTLGATVRRMPAADIALQSPVLSWLGVLDADLSGAVRADIAADGSLTGLAGTLDIDAGALQPLPDIPPVEFSSARTYFTFDPDEQRIDFSEIAVRSAHGQFTASGHTYLTELTGPWPASFVGQFDVASLEYDGDGVFEAPIDFSDLRTDLRLRLDPFTVDVGQLSFDQGEARIRVSARIAALEDGWHVAVDAETQEIRSERVLRHWPVQVSPVTRGWLAENLRTGVLRNVAAGLRFDTGRKPDAMLSFQFDKGEVSFLRQMPALEDASGRATLLEKRFTLYLDDGHINAGQSGVVEASGSMFSVPDTRPKPTMGEIDLRIAGPLEAALTILNRPPLRIMDRAGRQPALASADATGEARIVLPLREELESEDIDFSVSAALSSVVSETIVEGRTLTSDRLDLKVSPEAVSLSGPLQLDGVPVRATWQQPLGDNAGQGGRVAGTIELSAETIDAFGIPLPNGLIGGRSQGQFELDLPPDDSPLLQLDSDLDGLTLAMNGLGWSKPARSEAKFTLSARLGRVPEVESISLLAPGLALEGTIDLTENGSFGGAVFDRLQVGDWLDGKVDLVPRGESASPEIRISGGRLDVRRLPGGPGGTQAGGPIVVKLDELVISDTLRLRPLVGTFQQGRQGLSGEFRARVNGGTPVRGALALANGGTAIRIQADDAGGAIADAGLTPNADGGTLDLVLTPVVGAARGTYDGRFLIETVRIRKAPLLADLLDAISIVGLLDQLAGPGILFDTFDGRFRLTPERLTLREAAGVGGSLGISADGIYDFEANAMDLEGVVSPVYFLNGIGAAVTRRGEGLFGFNYRMTGSKANPKVRVNPLSILAPGFFRQIFRRPPPGE